MNIYYYSLTFMSFQIPFDVVLSWNTLWDVGQNVQVKLQWKWMVIYAAELQKWHKSATEVP